jgi:hypothetical protein
MGAGVPIKEDDDADDDDDDDDDNKPVWPMIQGYEMYSQEDDPRVGAFFRYRSWSIAKKRYGQCASAGGIIKYLFLYAIYRVMA